ncbi:MAG: ABC transporter permease [Candidatus Omnitrophica bacterium]|nr:ABC transporter permease [Candidatus Omnitrophota bacterium]
MIFLAFRYLFSKKKQTFFTILGIFFGTVAFVGISGLMLGFRGYIIDQLVNNDAHIHIESREEFLSQHSLDQSIKFPALHVFWIQPPSGRKDNALIENPQQWYYRLKSDKRVAAFSGQLTAGVVFSVGKSNVSSSLTGCDPYAQVKVSTISKHVIEGRFEDLATGGNRIAIGEQLQKRLGVHLYQNVLVSLADRPATPFKVVAIYKFGNNNADSQAYSSLADVQKVNNTLNKVNVIAVKLVDFSQASFIAKTWGHFGLEKVESWDEINGSIFNVFAIQDFIRFMSTGSIILVAGFGIFNVLNMTVMQKRKDVAILRSMGYTDGDILQLFFLQGLMVGLMGTMTGLLVGFLVCKYASTLPAVHGPIDSGAGGTMQISFANGIYIQAAILSMMSAIISSIQPARTAEKLTPIEIIRAGAE